MLGSTIDGRYQVLRLLGAGGMGSVYEARHVGTNRRLALKIITGEFARSPALIQRFQIEAKAAGVIESQHVANVLDVGVDPKTGTPYLVMEYLEGQTLEQHLATRRAFPVELALRVAGQALLGLSKAHAAGIIHRDVKPGNVFLAERDAGEIVVKLLDFGIAKVRLDEAAGGATPSVTRTGHLVGTPLYMSPEQAGGDRPLTFSTDIWSLGVVLYEMISGRTPHHDVQAAGRLIIEICSTPTPPLRKYAIVEPHVEAIVMRALELDAAARFRDAKEMIDALRAIVPSFSIDESMLTPVRKLVIAASSDDISPESFARQPTAPAVPSTPPESLATAVSGEAPTVQVRASTTGAGALARQRDAAKPRGNALPWILIALAVVASVAFFWQRSPAQPSASATTPALPAPSAPPPATSAATLPLTTPTTTATVEVDAAAPGVKRTVRLEKKAEPKIEAKVAPSTTPAKKPYDPLSEM